MRDLTDDTAFTGVSIFSEENQMLRKLKEQISVGSTVIFKLEEVLEDSDFKIYC